MSGTVITGRDPATGRGIAVEIAGSRIAAVRPEDDIAPDAPYLAPGLVDLQVNGYAGIDLNDGTVTPERVIALGETLARLGVTTYLPTLITASEATIVAGLEAIAEARRHDHRVAHAVPFVHVEGPFLSPEDGPRGAHPRAHIRPPDLQEFRRWQAASGNLVGMITLSPRGCEALSFIRAVAAEGVHVAIGHTDASPEEIHAAVEAGARLSTHLGNGTAAHLPRHPNFIWAQLADDRLSAGFIADGHHLPADAFKAMLRAKSIERAFLVSDTVALGGMAPGLYDQPIGGRVEVTEHGRLGIPGTPYLAGAVRPLAEDVAIAAAMADLTLADALRLATRNPGRFVGNRGRIEAGTSADLARFDWHPGAGALTIRDVFLRGEEVS